MIVYFIFDLFMLVILNLIEQKKMCVEKVNSLVFVMDYFYLDSIFVYEHLNFYLFRFYPPRFIEDRDLSPLVDSFYYFNGKSGPILDVGVIQREEEITIQIIRTIQKDMVSMIYTASVVYVIMDAVISDGVD